MAPTLANKFYVPSGSSGGNSNTLVTGSFTPNNGDVLIVKGGTWDTTATLNTPTGGSQTYTQRVVVNPGSNRSWVSIWSCTVSGSPGSMTVSVSVTASSLHSIEVEWWQSASLAATPVTAQADSNNGTPSGGSINTSAANSVISMVLVDWQSRDPATRAYVNSADVTEEDLLDAHASADSVHYYWRQAVASAGATGFGLTAPTAMNYSMAAIEILDAASGPTLDAPPYHLLAIAPGRMSPGGLWVPAPFTDVDQPISISLTDTASGADSISVAVAMPLADTAGGTDALTAAVTLSLADTGSGADAITVAAAIPATDAGTGSDQLATTAAAALADTGSAADQLTVVATVALTDTASGVDALSVSVVVALADTAAGADALTVAAAVPITDAAGAADAISVSGSGVVSVSETGAGADVLALSAAAALAEAAAGADVCGATAAATTSDVVAAAEQIAATAVLAFAETVAAADALLVATGQATRGHMAGRSRTGPDASGRSRTGVDMDHRPRGGASMGGT